MVLQLTCCILSDFLTFQIHRLHDLSLMPCAQVCEIIFDLLLSGHQENLEKYLTGLAGLFPGLLENKPVKNEEITKL